MGAGNGRFKGFLAIGIKLNHLNIISLMQDGAACRMNWLGQYNCFFHAIAP
jgi:hypothetical protein